MRAYEFGGHQRDRRPSITAQEANRLERQDRVYAAVTN